MWSDETFFEIISLLFTSVFVLNVPKPLSRSRWPTG